MNASTIKRRGLAIAMAFAIALGFAVPCTAQAETGDMMLTAGGVPGLSVQATGGNNVALYIDSATQKTKTLTAIGLNAKKATWSSSNAAVVAVKAGKVTAKKVGKATVKAKQGTRTFIFKVAVKKVTISKKSATLQVGKTLTLKLNGDTIASAKSSNAAVASVTKAGKVTAKKAGKATITLKSKQGGKYTCSVTVKKAAVTTGPMVTGAEVNSVVLAYEFFEDKYGDDVMYIMHIKVKDGYADYAKWGKYFKPILSAGATCTIAGDESYTALGHTIGSAVLTVKAGGATRTYYVEAYPESSVADLGVFEGNTAK